MGRRRTPLPPPAGIRVGSISDARSLPLLLLAVAVAVLWALAGPARGDEQRARVVAPDQLAEVLAEPDPPLLLDVRTREEWEAGHVPGAHAIPIGELAERASELEAFREHGVIAYCERGPRAERALDVLREAGFEKVGILDGSMSRWRAEGRPIEQPVAEAPAATGE
jgi:phage shock protein E